MFMNITSTEWEETKGKLAAALIARWPWLYRANCDIDHGLSVESPLMSASAEPKKFAEGCATVRIRVDRSACIMGGVADIAEAARMLAEVRDCMLFIHGETSNLVVWQDGECPCGSCSGRGTSQGRPCDRCGGKGKR